MPKSVPKLFPDIVWSGQFQVKFPKDCNFNLLGKLAVTPVISQDELMSHIALGTAPPSWVLS
ncbi:MAG: hypothetical protein IH950_15055 [Bacteroidetes bacterium]|nr:hypothetical protein [Bacteroidota bacterium]